MALDLANFMVKTALVKEEADTTTIKIVTQSNQGVISFDFDCGLIKIKGLIMINFPYSKS